MTPVIERSALVGLLEWVKGATGPDRELDAAIGFALKWYTQGHDCFHWIEADGTYVQSINPKPFTSSLDAALALTERVCSDRALHPHPIDLLNAAQDAMLVAGWKPNQPLAPQLARFLIAALLQALIAQADSPDQPEERAVCVAPRGSTPTAKSDTAEGL